MNGATMAGVGEAAHLLSKRSRRRLVLLVLANASLSVADLIGVLLIGVLTLSLVAVTGGPVQGTGILAQFIDPATLADPKTVLWMAALAAVFLGGKSIAASWLTRRTLIFLAHRQAEVTSGLVRGLFRQPLSWIELRSSQQIIYAMTSGTAAAVVGLLGSAALAAAEFSLLGLLALVLLRLDPVITVVAIAFFAAIAGLLHLVLGRKAASAGQQLADARTAVMSSLQDSLSSYRELSVSNALELFSGEVDTAIVQDARATASTVFISQFPKYIYETALLVAAFGLAVWAFAQPDPTSAVATVAVFLAAGTRIMPSMLRLQNCLTSMRNSTTQAEPTLKLARDIETAEKARPAEMRAIAVLENSPLVSLRKVTARYPARVEPVLREVTLDIQAGTTVALVGPTGSGKSTLADVILGVLPVSGGEALVAGLPPRLAFQENSRLAAYVPQVVSLVRGSVRRNVCLGLPPEEVDDERIWNVLRDVRLESLVTGMPGGLDAEVGDRGTRLSGGQRQRLGLARALYRLPRLIVLDEATSALDAETEAAVTSVLTGLPDGTTTIVIAHRLATVRQTDEIVYLDGGSILARGSFEEVRAAVPAFDRSAQLLGL